MKTLYISDLDGTLLRSDERISEYTAEVINRLVENGMLFSYATARSWLTARKVTAGLTAQIPVIIYNGAFILDSITQKILLENYFKEQEAVQIIKEFIHRDILPIVYTMLEGKEKFFLSEWRRDQRHEDFSGQSEGRRQRKSCEQQRAFISGKHVLFYLYR